MQKEKNKSKECTAQSFAETERIKNYGERQNITITLIFFFLCSTRKIRRDIFSRIYLDVSPGNIRQALSENRSSGWKTDPERKLQKQQLTPIIFD